MNTDSSALLAQLQDIHSAGHPGWWPPAPGWWVLSFLLLLLFAFLFRKLLDGLSVRRRRAAWIRALDELNQEHNPEQQPHEYLASLNRLFRAVAVKAFPGTACARLQGEQWVDFIASLMPDNADSADLSALVSGPYEPAPHFDASALNDSAKTWVKLYG